VPRASFLLFSISANVFSYRVICQEKEWDGLVPLLRAAPWVALDTEADSLHAYPEKLCLIQVSIPGVDELIDPLAGLDLSPLFAELQRHELIIHAADYDLRLLRRRAEFVPTAVFDTMLAARLVGLTEFGLNRLVAKYCGVTLEKGAQTANWARRPLPERLTNYARNDTRYLQPLAQRLREELQQKGRLDWHRQSCARLIEECQQLRPADPNLVWRMGGCERLSRLGLAVLRALWHWRELEAVQHNKPPYFVLSHELLLTLAAAAAAARPVEPLLPPHWSARRRTGLLEALAAGLSTPVAAQPEPIRHRSRRFTMLQHRRFNDLQQRRDQRAHELGLDPTFIASRATLMALARDGAGEDLMPWQRELLLA
jgi:ribonuclease D